MLGLGEIGSAAPGERTLYSPGPEFRTLHATLDVKKANELLDKLGLDKKDAEGFRLRTDGKGRLRIEVTTYLGFLQFTQIVEMISEQWKKIGIDGDGLGAWSAACYRPPGPGQRAPDRRSRRSGAPTTLCGHTPTVLPVRPRQPARPEVRPLVQPAAGSRARSRSRA